MQSQNSPHLEELWPRFNALLSPFDILNNFWTIPYELELNWTAPTPSLMPQDAPTSWNAMTYFFPAWWTQFKGHSLCIVFSPFSGRVNHSVSPSFHGNSCTSLELHFLFYTIGAGVIFSLSQPCTPGEGSGLRFSFCYPGIVPDT